MVEAGVTMETVVIMAIGVLATIFLASFVALVVVCRHRYCHPHDLLHHFDSKSVTPHQWIPVIPKHLKTLNQLKLELSKIFKCDISLR